MAKSPDRTAQTAAQQAVRKALTNATPPVTLKQASRAIGMNDAYLQQFLERGTPRQLPEELRYKLANFLGISQHRLAPLHWQTGIHGSSPAGSHLRAVPFIDVSASAGAGSVIDAVEDHAVEQWHFPKTWLQQHANGQIESLKLLTVSGDSMAPRLLHGDIVMIDTFQRTASPPGIFVLHDGLGLVIKQIEPIPNTAPVTLRIFSENTAYSAYDRSIEEVHIIGRVVWFARTM